MSEWIPWVSVATNGVAVIAVCLMHRALTRTEKRYRTERSHYDRTRYRLESIRSEGQLEADSELLFGLGVWKCKECSRSRPIKSDDPEHRLPASMRGYCTRCDKATTHKELMDEERAAEWLEAERKRRDECVCDLVSEAKKERQRLEDEKWWMRHGGKP